MRTGATALAKAPGLGKKGAQKIILELKGSIDLSQIEGASKEVRSAEDAGSEQVVEGLMSLGWRQPGCLACRADSLREQSYQCSIEGR